MRLKEPQPGKAAHYDRPQPGWRMLQPGFYVDAEQAMHIFPDEVLRAYGWPDTPENRRIIEQAAEDVARGKGIPHSYTEGKRG